MKWQTVAPWIGLVFLFLLTYITCIPRWPRETAKVTKIVVEIGQLQTAMQAYEEKHEEFPPCLAGVTASDRKVRFMRHLKKAFEHSAYGDFEQAFDRLNAQVQSGFNSLQAYNFKDANDTIRPLDLTSLDAAESLVFWLGGFPTPYNPQTKLAMANRRIFGFHRDADDPMRRDAAGTEGLDPLRYRTEPFYQFDETRLSDVDDDGWFEYLPRPQAGGSIVAPFVYFDAKCYVDSGAKPDLLGTVRYPADAMLAKQFGFAVPYAASFVPSTSAVTWHNPKGFQIVCGGLDGMYDTPAETGVEKRIVVVPAGNVYRLPDDDLSALSIEEGDNLTSFSSNTLDGMRQESGR